MSKRYFRTGGAGKVLDEEDFQEEIELIQEDVSGFKIPYSACQYFHDKVKNLSRDQLEEAVKHFHKAMEKRFNEEGGGIGPGEDTTRSSEK